MYPCVLAYRSTRSIVLSAVGRWDEALRVLDYVRYATAPAKVRSHQQVSRAFALMRSGKTDEARDAAAKAVRMDPTTAPFLDTLGLATTGNDN
jgi:uncharacterized membrane-anchored protein